MANFLTNLFSSGASSLVQAVGDALDKNITTDEERKALDNEITKASLQHEEAMANIELQHRQVEHADRDSARVNQSRVQESEHASWMAKNVQPILALGIIGLTFSLFIYIIMFGDQPGSALKDSAMKDIVIYILGALTTVATQVVSYFFGSSSGSKDKTQALNDLAKRK